MEPTVDPIGEIPAEAVATVSEPSDATDSEGAPVAAEAPAVVAEPLSLFELDPVDVKRAKHRVVLSLYGDTDSVTPAPGKVEPVAEERPVPPPQAVPAVSPSPADVPQEEPAATSVPVGGAGHRAVPAENGAAVLGETLNSDVKTVSDLIAVTTPPAAVGQEPVADLRQAFFGGDMDACGRTIDRLNEFDDLDECMIYIAENFDWNPNSDGAKLLVDLIERKLA